MKFFIKHPFVIVLIVVFVSCINVSASENDNVSNPELYKLIDSANHEMNGDFNNRLDDGTFKEIFRMHLEPYNQSVVYVGVFITSYIDALNSDDEYKTKLLEVFKCVKPNPEFKKLLDYLIEHGLPLYHYSISKDSKFQTPVLEYNTDDLKQIGIYAE